MSAFRDVPESDAQRPRKSFADPEPLEVPEDAESAQDKHGVVRYYWDEPATITKAVHIMTDSGLTGFIVELVLSDDREVKGFGLVNYACYGDDASDKARRSHLGMSDRTLGVVRALLEVTGFLKPGATLTGKLTAKLFPAAGKDAPDSALVGKSVIARVCDEPDTRPRKDGSLPKPGTRRTVVANYKPADEDLS
jgi:hypothetical protein